MTTRTPGRDTGPSIVLIGFRGCGKSTVGRELAEGSGLALAKRFKVALRDAPWKAWRQPPKAHLSQTLEVLRLKSAIYELTCRFAGISG